MFDKDIAQLAIKKLQGKGVKFADGLAPDEVKDIEVALGADIPPDLKILLTEAVPVGIIEGGDFPDWHKDPQSIIFEARAGIERSFEFDIKENGYWHELFGSKTEDTKLAVEQAVKVIRSWPPLIRVYGHRFMPTEPSSPNTPVFSVWQPGDTIYYGNNLADYLQKEFEIDLPITVPKEPLRVPYWGEVFDL